MEDKILQNIISIIRHLNEEVPTNSLAGGQIAGTKEAGDDPPVDLRKNKYKRLPEPYRLLFRRRK
jgi:hypothetical protein